MKAKKKFISNIDYNKSSEGCPACSAECKKINRRINNRKLSEIKSKEFPHILKVFNFDLSNSSVMSSSLEGQITCEPCSSECEKIKRKINNRKLSDIKDVEVMHILSPFNIKY